MIKFLQLPLRFDAGKIFSEVQQLEAGAWKLHYQKLHYEGEWTALPLRSVNGSVDNIIISPVKNVAYRNTSLLLQCPYIQEVLDSFGFPLKSVRLLKLKAGAIIKEHNDAGLCYEQEEIRLHIPVCTHEDVEFNLDGERMHLKEGECWYMNFNLTHSIYNRSQVDRIHLVIDAEVNERVKEIFAGPGLAKKEMEDPGYDADTKRQIIAQLRQMNTDTANRLADEMEATL